ncbi:MAG: DNA-directed RNA polymerase subunit H [Methanomassiliicoccales archaeon]|nr:DNA-directed RNA polymerase subunit H [Methanomassiliicoccales archaeon]
MVSDVIEFNVLEHELVPEHHLLTEEEAEKVLKELRITRDQLPKIRKSDACVKVLEKIYGPIEEGRIIKIVRKSPTAEIFVAYRMVIRG